MSEVIVPLGGLDWAVLAACGNSADPDRFFPPPEDDEEPPWQDLARCAEVDGELFFPEKGQSTQPAKRICARCEVREPCLEYALANGERFGVYGGKSERERRAILNERQAWREAA